MSIGVRRTPWMMLGELVGVGVSGDSRRDGRCQYHASTIPKSFKSFEMGWRNLFRLYRRTDVAPRGKMAMLSDDDTSNPRASNLT